ncbi:TnsA endonuclease N-terminal domain-containing protein [Geomonas nitrogeniifigens]|uniref:TnsA endonuclease N-terminal domain-containing protein n=1 Tax=Geomonas diazotrophica TaxID=2843197 RepID=A0ABX8JFX2_9BACT|nr:TnsA endonuclease N-terminal domain-containing protein [Geomonas nitrogeniifigens]QWV97285.1 TnsA endonuclease N-terminal domain-containing protein [Geomonas nitrogeniifigens]
MEIVEKWIAKGYGQGEGKAYRPFFHVRDVPSKGRSSIVEGLKSGRTHHYLSDLEYYHHVLAEFSPSVVDIRDQYALLPWGETQDIARDLGIRYPVYRYTSTPIVMTSDLVLTLQNGDSAVVSVKPSSELPDEEQKDIPQGQARTLEKLRIEQEYWKRRGVPWVLSTEKKISIVRAKNLAFLRTAMVSRELDLLMPHIHYFVDLFHQNWEPAKPLNSVVIDAGQALGLSVDAAFCLFGRAVWLHWLPVDLDTPIDHFTPVNLVWT